jgi:tetratricopeptide (TPR) repeat protein
MELFMKATQARLLGERSKAIHLYEETLKLDPSNAASMFELGKLYNSSQQFEPAVAYAKKAVDIDPENIWYHLLLADLYKQDQRFDDAVKVYDNVLDRWPDRYEVYMNKANMLLQQQKLNEANKVFDELQEKFGFNEELVMQQYSMFMSTGNYDRAMDIVDRAIETQPDEPRYFAMQAEVYEHMGEMEKAHEAYKRVLEIDPSNSMVRIAMAEHFYATEKPEKAIEQLETAFRDPELPIDSKMQVLLGFFEMTQRAGLNQSERDDMTAKAYELIDLLKEMHPDDGKPYTIHGDFLMRDGRFKEARDQFRKATEYEQDKFAIWQQLVLLDSRINDPIGMRDDASAAAELFPTQPVFYLFKGVGHSQLDEYDEAIEALNAGKNLVVDDPQTKAQFLSSLGDAYHAADRHKLSDQAYDQALELVPDDAGVLNNYSYYLSLRNEQLEKAERMSKRSNELAPDNPSYLDTYAWVLYQMGSYEKARVWIEKALSFGGTGEGVLLEHYGDILYKLGETDLAVGKWKEAQSAGGGSDLLDKKIIEGRLFE